MHAADLARACANALDTEGSGFHAYNLPGGETLTLNAMVARTARQACASALPLPVPLTLLLALARCARRLPLSSALAVDSAARMAGDHVFDGAPAMRELGHRPRDFAPSAPDLGS